MNRTGRTIASATAAVTLAAAAWATGPVAASADPITLTFWDHVQSSLDVQTAYEDAAAAFQELHPNVTVEIQTFPFEEYQTKLMTAVRGGSGPDIMSLDQPWIPQFAEAGVLLALDDHVGASDAVLEEQFFPAAWASTFWKDTQWAVPLGFDVWETLVWNPELFEAAGLDPDSPPTTWAELLDYAEQLTGDGQFGVVLPSALSEVIPVFNNSFVFSNGGAIIDAEGNVVIDSPENIETYTYLYTQLAQHAPNGLAGLDQTAAEALFTSGKVAMMFNGNWSQETLDAQSDFDWRMAVPPVPNAGDTFVGATGGWNLAVSADSRHADLAYAFIEFITTDVDIQVGVAANTPAFIPAAEVYLQQRKYSDVLLTISQHARPRPSSPFYPQISEVQQVGAQRILGGEDVAAVVADMQAEIEGIVGG